MFVWEVLGKRSDRDDWTVVGGVKAPDAEMALLLARETHFRHKEGVQYAVRRRGEDEIHVGVYPGDVLGGITDHSYRRQEAYAGVGARLKRVAEEMARSGVRIGRPRPPIGWARPPKRLSPAEAGHGNIEELSPEDLAAHGTAG